MKVHPYADDLPAMDEDDRKALEISLRADGQLDPIIKIGDEILDGKHRYKICQELNIKPKFANYKGATDGASLLSFVRRKATHRNMTPSQIAAYADKVKQRLVELSKNGEGANLPPTNSDLAQDLGISEKQIKEYAALKKKATESLLKAIDDGKFTISDAKTIVDLPKATQAKIVARAERDETSLKKAADAIADESNKPKAGPKPKEDEVGQVIPEKLLPVFYKAAEFEDRAVILNKIKQWAEEVAKNDAGSYLHLQSFLGDIQALKNTLRQSKPYAICPYCQSKKTKCDACKGRGFVTKALYNSAPQEMRA